ncbi:MAG: hypothetical protein V2B19_05260 [Pseudomonadota bacterium]
MKRTLITLAIVFAVFFFLYRSCTKGYDQYAYFVHVKNETVFKATLSDADSQILDHARRSKKEVMSMDQQIDKSDGPEKGMLRWYDCSGIDCDEGWQRGFLLNNSR